MKTKAELQKQLNELQKEIDNFVEPKQELNRWYKVDEEPKTLWFVEDIKNGNGIGYGLICGSWTSHTETISINSSSFTFRLATEKEVETALIKEAKKRGFREGVKFKGFRFNNDSVLDLFRRTTVGEYRLFNADLNEINVVTKCNVYNTIFKDGKWAEIIESSKPTINGYEIEVDGDIIKFGCQKFKINEVKHLSRLLNGGVDWVTSFKIFGNGPSDYYEITVKQLKEVVDYLNK